MVGGRFEQWRMPASRLVQPILVGKDRIRRVLAGSLPTDDRQRIRPEHFPGLEDGDIGRFLFRNGLYERLPGRIAGAGDNHRSFRLLANRGKRGLQAGLGRGRLQYDNANRRGWVRNGGCRRCLTPAIEQFQP